MGYEDFAHLAQKERSGIDYRVRVRRAQPTFAIMAPHGGSIEPGTSEIAEAIAAEKYSFYTLEGLKPPGTNGVLHITSTKFDEPMCFTVLGHSAVVVTLHGEESGRSGDDNGDGSDYSDGGEDSGDSSKTVFVGGRDKTLMGRIEGKLRDAGFHIGTRDDIPGEHPENICNRGTSGAGVQLELSYGLRKTMFESLRPEGRKHPTETFDAFVAVVRLVLDQA